MFKKLYGEINGIFAKLDAIQKDFRYGYDSFCDSSKSIKDSIRHMPQVQSMEKIIASQQRTIEQLTNALKDKYEHGLFVVSEDCKTPMVIRNGKEVLNERTTYFRITWAVGEAPLIETEQTVGTFAEEN